MLSSSKCPFKSKGMHFSVLSKMFEEETVRVVESLHLQMNPFSDDMRAREDIFEVEFEKRRRCEDVLYSGNSRVWNGEILE